MFIGCITWFSVWLVVSNCLIKGWLFKNWWSNWCLCSKCPASMSRSSFYLRGSSRLVWNACKVIWNGLWGCLTAHRPCKFDFPMKRWHFQSLATNLIQRCQRRSAQSAQMIAIVARRTGRLCPSRRRKACTRCSRLIRCWIPESLKPWI